MRGRILIIAFALLMASCSEPENPGFTCSDHGLWYKIAGLGEGESHPSAGDYVTASIVIKLGNDSVLYDTRMIGPEGAVTFELPEIKSEKDYREGYYLLTEGDSGIFLTDAGAFYAQKGINPLPEGIQPDDLIRVETFVIDIMTPSERMDQVKAENLKKEVGEFEEKKILDQYVSEYYPGVVPVYNGMYHIVVQRGSGIATDSARVLLINYKGSFLNGRYFDLMFEHQPFEFLVGAEDQLIKGLEAGVKRMHEGEKAKFIIPSHLAFGSEGSSSGIVPPFTPVVYEVELLKVQ